MSETGWLAIVSPILVAMISAVAYLWTQRDKIYEQQIAKLEEEIKAGRLKVSELQDRALAALQAQLDEARKRIETDQRLAASFEQQTDILRGLAGHEIVATQKAKPTT